MLVMNKFLKLNAHERDVAADVSTEVKYKILCAKNSGRLFTKNTSELCGCETLI